MLNPDQWLKTRPYIHTQETALHASILINAEIGVENNVELYVAVMGKPTSIFAGLTPNDARELAERLIYAATEVERNSDNG